MKRRRSSRLSWKQQQKEAQDVFLDVFMEKKGEFEAICRDDRLRDADSTTRFYRDLFNEAKESCTNRLYHACEKGNLSVVKELAHSWAGDINAPTSSERKYSPLAVAIVSRRKPVVKYLLELPDIDVNQVYGNQEFALYRAIQNRTSDSDFVYVDMLLAHPKINVNNGNICVTHSGYADDARNCIFVASLDNDEVILKRLVKHPGYSSKANPKNWKLSPFMVACSLGHLEAVEVFVKESPEFDLSKYNHLDPDPLILACESGNVELVEYLLDLGAKPKACEEDSRNPDRASCFVAAAAFARNQVLTFLLEDERVEVTPLDKQLALNAACEEKNLSTVNFLLKHADVELDHPRLITSALQHHTIVERLLKEENLVVPIEPIIVACRRALIPQLELLFDDPRGSVHRFAQNEKGKMPMMYLASQSSSKAFSAFQKLFLSHPDFQLNQADGDGNTLLMTTIHTQNWKLFDHLLTHDDLDVNAKNNAGVPPFHEFLTYRYDGHEAKFVSLMKHPRTDLSVISTPVEPAKPHCLETHNHSYMSVSIRPTTYRNTLWIKAIEFLLQQDSLPAPCLNQKHQCYRTYIHPMWKLAETNEDLLRKMIEHPNFVADDALSRCKRTSYFCDSLLMILERGIVTPTEQMMDIAIANEHVDLTRNLVYSGLELPEDKISASFREALQAKKPKSAATAQAPSDSDSQ